MSHATGQGSSSGSSQAGQATHPSGTSSRIDVNNAMRAHPLFGMLDYIIRNTSNTQNQTSKLETRISSLAAQTIPQPTVIWVDCRLGNGLGGETKGYLH